ncbi:hypothetical protein IFO69_15520 [Echinicola sp. CAU 1574]|uniref:Uncharacterized protein n=1 Tax=Echinicola arenosa TaxID=2774144 RepID=A0ABR9ANN2_9BACT|nr:hypothetical protein [Echinicola arenosa]MBD8490164.1 hypothetical protein [Echinicola arenosa]
MRLYLFRRLFDDVGQGTICWKGQQLVKTVEFPYTDKYGQASFIPEGLYPLHRKYIPQLGWNIELEGDGGNAHPIRSFDRGMTVQYGGIHPVLFHMDAIQLKESRIAYQNFKQFIFNQMNQGDSVHLNIITYGTTRRVDDQLSRSMATTDSDQWEPVFSKNPA